MEQLKILIDFCIQIFEINIRVFGYVFTLKQLFVYSTLCTIILTGIFKLFDS